MSYDPNQPPYGQQQPPYGQPPYGQPQQPYGQPEYPPTQYVGTPMQGGYIPQPPPPQKKSLRWLWITLGIIGGIIVLGCVGCGITAVMGIGFFAKVAGPTFTATEYYTAIKNQDYSQAYTYWDTSGTTSLQGQQATQDAFILVAQAVDTAKGPVTNFSVQPNTNDPSLVTVTVTRNGSSYVVQLQLHQVNGTWKIIKASGI
jgi:hypothetical protein